MSVSIILDDDEALVLFELLGAKNLLPAVDVPERNALWALEALLEKALDAPFKAEYPKLLEEARRSLIEKYGA